MRKRALTTILFTCGAIVGYIYNVADILYYDHMPFARLAIACSTASTILALLIGAFRYNKYYNFLHVAAIIFGSSVGLHYSSGSLKDIMDLLDTYDFFSEKSSLDSIVNTSAQYISDFDVYSEVERTISNTTNLSYKGKFIVFQGPIFRGWHRLYVYDESDELLDQGGPKRHLGEMCSPVPGWKFGDPVLCATDRDGNPIVLHKPNIISRLVSEHYYIVYVQQ